MAPFLILAGKWCRVAPKRLNACVPTAGLAITLIGLGLFAWSKAGQHDFGAFVIVLVNFLGFEEFARWQNGRHDGLTQIAGRLGDSGLGCGFLRTVFVEHGGAIAFTAIAELAAGIGWVNRAEKQMQELVAGNNRIVEFDFDRLIVTRATFADVFVSWVVTGGR